MASQRFYARKRVSRSDPESPLTNSLDNEIRDSSKEALKWKQSKIRYAVGAFSLGLAMLVCSWMTNSLFIDKLPSGEGSKQRHSGFPRFVTVIEPSEVDPSSRHRRLKSIHDTWGPAARAIFVVTNITDYSEAADNGVISETTKEQSLDFLNAYPKLLLVPPGVGADRSTPYLRYITRTIFERVNPDFAFFVNDHSYVIPEHVCAFLGQRDPSQDMYAGHALAVGKETFHPNSAGYLLSRSTLQKLVQKWNEKDPICTSQESHPGLAISRCLDKVLNISAEGTRQYNKVHRFHAFPLMRLVSGGVDKWYNDLSTEENLYGKECCANDTVSFHYVDYLESRAVFAIRKALLEKPQMTNDELKTVMMNEWPNKDIGAYSRGLPKSEDVETWEALIHVMRSISSRPERESTLEC